MTTTFEKFKGTQRGNYCDLPSIDVEIIENPVRTCKTCGEVVVFNPSGGPYQWGEWEHATKKDHTASIHSTCFYCGCNDPELVKYRQHAWHDAVECERCGGSHGYAIGD